jgi:hypothetical protein
MNNNGSQQPAAGKEDYLDKGLDTAEKKFGGAAGANTEKNRGVNEKIVCYSKQEAVWASSMPQTYTDWLLQTDGARGMFEKATGKDVSDKVSN